MYTRQTDLARLLSGTRAFIVPQFQRHYKWKVREWQALWDDLETQYLSPEVQTGNIPSDEGHFIGSVVLHPAPGPSTMVSRYWVIDGQQRLTTILVLIAAIREFRRSIEPAWDSTEYTNLYLANQYSTDSPHRLEPGRSDRDDFINTVYREQPSGQIGSAFRWFTQKIRTISKSDDNFHVSKLMNALLLRFLVVEINTSADDNINEIFNTINYEGVRLSGIDLIRNHAFMQFPTSEADEVHFSLWQPMEAELGEKELEQYFWAQLVRFHPDATQRDTYGPFQRRLRQIALAQSISVNAAAREELNRLHRELPLYLAVTQRSSAAAYPATLAGPLQRLQTWGSQTYVPLALETLSRLDQGLIDPDDAAETLDYVVSYLVRRALAGVPTNNLNRVLSGVPAATRSDVRLANGVARELKKTGSYWPTDLELAERGLSTPIGATLKPDQLKFVLAALSPRRDSQVEFDELTVLELMPTPLPEGWRDALSAMGEDPELATTRGKTIGNLLLASRNAHTVTPDELRAFETAELEGAAVSPLNWGPTQVLERSANLLATAQEVWPRPGDDGPPDLSRPSEPAAESSPLVSGEAVLELLPADTVVALSDLQALTAASLTALTGELEAGDYQIIHSDGVDLVGSLPSMTDEETRGARRLDLSQLRAMIAGDDPVERL